jgi:hypothetical protein
LTAGFSVAAASGACALQADTLSSMSDANKAYSQRRHAGFEFEMGFMVVP